MKRILVLWFVGSALLLGCVTSPPPQPDVTTSEEVRIGRPWIPETTELVRNTTNLDMEYDYMLKDFTDYPFVDDPRIVGTWTAVDFVQVKEEFVPGERFWRGPKLDREIIFESDGSTSIGARWTSGHILHIYWHHTDSLYEIVEHEGGMFMFMEHKSGDYILRFGKPGLYVFQKQ